MNILIAGGTGFLGRFLERSLLADGHNVFILTRRKPRKPNQIRWDGISPRVWGERINEMDAVINLCGYGTEHWPWTERKKQKFVDSRVLPARAFVAAIREASHRPRVYIQASGINHYGLRGETIADESTSPADDFLAQLTVQWEDASQPIEELGVRRVILRQAVVLARHGGLFPLMALPSRLFFCGKFGDGNQSMPWIHIVDQVNALRFLLQNENAQGPFNLIAPQITTNENFMGTISRVLKRPFWFHIPTILLRLILGEMSILLTEGRFARPKRLLELGYKFKYEILHDALQDLIGK